MEELLAWIARGLVDDPEAVQVERLDEGKVRDWLGKGAQPTESVRRLLKTQNLA